MKRNGKMRINKYIALVFAFALFLSSGSINVFALEQAEVKIPVSVAGADSTAAIYDQNGTELKTLPLKVGEDQAFTLTCTGLNTLSYTIKLKDQDTDTVTYDKTVYAVKVDLYYVGDELRYGISADPIGVLGDNGKPEKLEFTNVKKSSGGGGKPRPGIGDPPVKVQKRIEGEPEEDATFIFVMKPKDPSYPLQASAVNGETEMPIIGAGEKEFGDIAFTEAGTYEYTVTERNTGKSGWTYDATVYTVRYEVTDVNGELVSTRTIYKGEEAVASMKTESIVFTNKYETGTTPDPKPTPDPTPDPDDKSPGGGHKPQDGSIIQRILAPGTGDYNNLILPGIALVAALLLIIFLIRRRRKDDQE